jgi:hypothetical protein
MVVQSAVKHEFKGKGRFETKDCEWKLYACVPPLYGIESF